MNTSKFFNSILLVIVLILTSCSDGELISVIEERPFETYLTKNCGNRLFFQNGGGELTINIKCVNSTWEFSNIPSWLSFSETSGNKEADVKIQAQRFTEVGREREWELYLDWLSTDGMKRDTILVSQSGIMSQVHLFAKGDTCIVSNCKLLEIPFETNTDDISAYYSGHDWLDVQITNRGGQKYLRITLQENESENTRVAHAGVSVNSTYMSSGLTIYQYPSMIDGINKGYAYVDLGLSSGTLWALSNLGDKSEFNNGYYYCWAETTANKYNPCDKEHYVYMSKFTYDSYSWATDWGYTKYTLSTQNISYRIRYDGTRQYSTPDHKKILDDKDNAAIVTLGSFWDMPTIEQVNELKQECVWKWTSINGVYGYKVTGPNGKSLFFGAFGVVQDKTTIDNNSAGLYWTKNITSTTNSYGNSLYFDASDYTNYNGYLRYRGGRIRPVVAK